MYYRMQFSSEQAIYTNAIQANQLLLRVYLLVNSQGGSLLDYTLLPTLLDLLLYMPRGKPKFRFLCQPYTLELIPNNNALLTHYRNISKPLPLFGKNYPLCGTYEAYHGSTCLSTLGKTGPLSHNISIQTILEEKCDASLL